jgi:hypothetical protein
MKKRCCRCRLPKDLDEFYHNSTRPDGRNTACKKCSKKYFREYYNKNRSYHNLQTRLAKEKKLGRRLGINDPVERLILNLEKTKTCWLWTGTITGMGYGTIRVRGRYVFVHRYAWELGHRKLSRWECVLHRCDNPRCIRPSHLWVGTQAENQDDKVGKFRQAVGEKNGRHKLTEEQVIEIRRRLRRGDRVVDLASEFNITRSSVRKIGLHLSWNCV